MRDAGRAPKVSVLGTLVQVGSFLAEHADVVEDVASALANGSPKEAIKATIRGVKIDVSRAALAEEFAAAEARDGNHGQRGYEAYAVSTGGKTFDGRDMPKWNELPERIRAAWEAAADAIRA